MTPTPPQEQTERLTDADIVDIRDLFLPSQGEHFDCVAFARELLRRASMQAQAPEVAALQREVEELRARYQWLRDRFLGADFDWGQTDEDGDHGTPVLLIKFDGVTVYGDLDCTVEAAMASKAEVPNG